MIALEKKIKLRRRPYWKVEKRIPIEKIAAAMLFENGEAYGQLAESEITLEQLIGALTDKDKRLNFPIALPPVELGKQTIGSIYAAALILSIGAITTAAILKK